jgi:3-isopropylmalate/(R)-2-methylmalate dehydratase small subunit
MSQAFTTLTGVAAALVEDNIDTDVIFPARFLLLMEKQGLGRYLFHDRRFDSSGEPIADFVLNREPFSNATILISRDNFGGGSSREHAVWSIADYGIRCVIASGFGEIFAGNCIRNGILPALVDRTVVATLAELAEQGPLTVDLREQTIRGVSGTTIPFSISASDRESLLNGWDDIDRILAQEAEAIRGFEQRQSTRFPWLYQDRQS